MATCLYNKESLQVLRISIRNHDFADVDNVNYVVKDNIILRNIDEGNIHKYRAENGFSLIINPANGIIREASSVELNNFSVITEKQLSIENKKSAISMATEHPIFRRISKALINCMTEEINILRQELNVPLRTRAQIRRTYMSSFKDED